MAEEFNLDGMLDVFLYESSQLMENLESSWPARRWP